MQGQIVFRLRLRRCLYVAEGVMEVKRDLGSILQSVCFLVFISMTTFYIFPSKNIELF